MTAEFQAIGGFAQVNLLEKSVEAGDGPLPWWSPIACIGLVGALAFGSGLWLKPQADAQALRVAAAEAQVQERTTQIETAARQNKGGSARDQADALQAALTQQERLLAALGGAVAAGPGVAATAQNFSALLEGLSRTRVDGLWLTQLRLDRRTHEVRLEGQARNAQLVSVYIDDLSRNDRFKGLVLSAVEVSRPAAHAAATADGPEPTRFKLVSPTTPAVPGGTAPNPPGAGR